MSEALKEISETLQAESGMNGGVSIWRKDRSEDYNYPGTVGDFLADPKNQGGEWLIDGGWGGPPGPIVVRWSPEGHWQNGGFNGRLFKRPPTKRLTACRVAEMHLSYL